MIPGWFNMGYISVKEASEKWGITERVVRQYCSDGRIPGAFLTGKTWNIPDDAEKPGRKARERKLPADILTRLRLEKDDRGYLRDTCLAAQDKFKAYLDYYKIEY